jgi:ABC-type protease/lipase transport system fused ATPase/permease subunit
MSRPVMVKQGTGKHMTSDVTRRGTQEMWLLRKQSRTLYWMVALFSLFANLLLLTGPIYMLQVYDRVLSSGSYETLVGLSLLVVFLYTLMGILDGVRGHISARIAARFQSAAEARVFDAVLRRTLKYPDAPPANGLNDLEAVRRCIASPIVTAVFDLPWTPVIFAAIFIFHPLLGVLSLFGAALLVLITIANQLLSRHSEAEASIAGLLADTIASQTQSDAEIVQALSMQGATFTRWQTARTASLQNQMRAMDVGSGFSALTRTLRMMLQSGMLGVGAWLVMSNQMTPGGMIAGSILLGRALTPIEVLLGQWPVL